MTQDQDTITELNLADLPEGKACKLTFANTEEDDQAWRSPWSVTIHKVEGINQPGVVAQPKAGLDGILCLEGQATQAVVGEPLDIHWKDAHGDCWHVPDCRVVTSIEEVPVPALHSSIRRLRDIPGARPPRRRRHSPSQGDLAPVIPIDNRGSGGIVRPPNH